MLDDLIASSLIRKKNKIIFNTEQIHRSHISIKTSATFLDVYAAVRWNEKILESKYDNWEWKGKKKRKDSKIRIVKSKIKRTNQESTDRWTIKRTREPRKWEVPTRYKSNERIIFYKQKQEQNSIFNRKIFLHHVNPDSIKNSVSTRRKTTMKRNNTFRIVRRYNEKQKSNKPYHVLLAHIR